MAAPPDERTRASDDPGDAPSDHGSAEVDDDGSRLIRAAAARAGYDEGRAGQLVDGARSVGLPAEDAARWLDGGFTPWGAAAWIGQGFESPAEAATYRSIGLDAKTAYWTRFDRRYRVG